jgi:hypothetical protein
MLLENKNVIANAATLLASDRASAMTAVLANVTCGSFVDL